MKNRLTLTATGVLGFIIISVIILTSCTQNNGGIESISAPTVVSTIPSDGMGNVDNGTSILITFNEAMQISSLTANVLDTSCNGSIQLSSDNFQTCIMMSDVIIASGSNRKISLTPAIALGSGLFQIKVTTSAKDVAGEGLRSEYISPEGFATPVIGELDPTFGSGGIVVVAGTAGASNLDDSGNDIVIDSDGRIVVVGNSSNSTDLDMVIWRYLPDGTLDTSFNSPKGYVISPDIKSPGANDNALSVVIDSMDNIVVGGYSADASRDAVIWRYTNDGTTDLSFNNGTGYILLDSSGGFLDEINSIAIDSVGAIIGVGKQSNGSDLDMSVWRLYNNGTLDTAFGSGGFITENGTAGGFVNDGAFDLVIDANDNIFVTGYSYQGPGESENMIVWKYKADGTLDTTFGTSGYFEHNSAAGGSEKDMGFAIALQPDASILVGGFSADLTNIAPDNVIWKLMPQGNLDNINYTPPDGYSVLTNMAGDASRDDYISGIAVDSTGKTVATGRYKTASSRDIALYRLKPDGSPDFTFNNSGMLLTNGIAGGNGLDEAHNIVLDSFDRIYIVGKSENSASDTDMVIMKIR